MAIKRRILISVLRILEKSVLDLAYLLFFHVKGVKVGCKAISSRLLGLRWRKLRSRINERLSYLWEPVVSDYMNRKPPPRVPVCLPGHGVAFGKVHVRPVQLCHRANSLLKSEVSRLGAFSPPSELCILRQLDPLYIGASFATL